MPTLEQLKAEHPEWCFRCGATGITQSSPCVLHSPVIYALIAAKLEDEAAIVDITNAIFGMVAECGDFKLQLTAEREAHEVTRKALEEADRALLFWRGYPEYIFSSDMEDGEPKQAVKNALAREAERQKGKVPHAD
ncbi:MAG: hypothetical protein JSS77_15885 [Acidobacteria bacterium]|nr:hypothetical protein [Acidobacteriota bacterium]